MASLLNIYMGLSKQVGKGFQNYPPQSFAKVLFNPKLIILCLLEFGTSIITFLVYVDDILVASNLYIYIKPKPLKLPQFSTSSLFSFSFYFRFYILSIYYFSSTCNYLIKCYNSLV